MADKVIVYRSIAEQRQDEYWIKFLDMNPWLVTGFMYLCLTAVAGLIAYTLYCVIIDRIRWRRRR